MRDSFFAIPIFLGLLLGMKLRFVSGNSFFVMGGFGFALLLWGYAEYRKVPFAKVSFLLVLVFLGFFIAGVQAPIALPKTEVKNLQGVVKEVKDLTRDSRVILDCRGLRLALHLPLECGLALGDRVFLSGTIQTPRRATNPGEFCYYTYLINQGVVGVVYPKEWGLVEKAQDLSLFARIKERVRRNLLPFDNRGLLRALLLGDREGLCEETKRDWQELGIGHLLAISGMHIGFFALLLLAFIGRLPLPRLAQLGIFSLLLLFYVLLSGGRPSAFRAFFMCVLGMTGKHYQKRVDSLEYLALSGCVILLYDPSLLDTMGFQFSFAASAGILLYSPFLGRFCTSLSANLKVRLGVSPDRSLGSVLKGAGASLLSFVVSSLSVSLVAQLSLYPLMAQQLPFVSLMAPLATLLFLPLVLVLMGLALLLGVFPLPLEPLLQGILGLEEGLREALLQIPAQIAVQKPSALLFLAWYGVFLGIGMDARRGAFSPKKWGLAFLVLAAIVSLPPSFLHPLEVTVLDVGQGDAIFIRTPQGQTLLVDGGGDSYYWQQRGRNTGLTRVVPFLHHRGVTKLDLMILTHPHEDHLHGLLAVLEHFPVDRVLDNGQIHTTLSYQRYLELIIEKEIPHQVVRRGDSFALRGGVKLHILHPGTLLSGTSSDLNNNSVVLCLEYKNRRFLFTGDLDWEGQLNLLWEELPVVDWIKMPHHGSSKAWVDEFFHAIRPKHAVISVGPNFFGHPSPRVLEGLRDLGARVYRTDHSGATTFYLWGPFLWRKHL